VKRAIVVVLAGLAVVLSAYRFWASDERRIERLLDAVADAVSQDADSGGVVGLAELTGLATHLATDVTLDPGAPFRPISGAQDVVSTVGRMRAASELLRLEVTDREVTVDSDAAVVNATARLAIRYRDGTESLEVRDVVIVLAKREAGWVIATTRVVGVVQPPP
jgi:ketosteroid isomerase-like protein